MELANYKQYIWVAGTAALTAITFAAGSFAISEYSSTKHPGGMVASISVSGEGEVIAVPDIATITLTVRESGKTVPEAQKAVEAKIAKALAALASSGVEKKDTKTLSYTVNPKYESSAVICTNMGCPVPRTVVTGYEVAQTVQVKVRAIDKAGEVVGLIGNENITEISGPEFTVDEPEKAKAEAKEKAIADAREKAQATAKALGVSLGEITSFGEDVGGYYPVMMSARAEVFDMKAAPMSATMPEGQSVIKSKVTITYTLN